MRVRWTPEAASDLARIVERIRGENSEAAHRVAQTIYNGIDAAAEFTAPWAPDTRELVFAPWPYIVVHEIVENQVQILLIRHSSQDWP
ncbi:MAG: type II toxin-antitoxin system RelE/ParE family toxin [Bryobacteraceae bacterium]|jgi:plasmid stabilization system protein ParE